MIYQQTPDFYNEYISHSAVWEGRSRYRNGEDELEHGWVKDAAAKAHKYISRWRNKAGKWVYQYKNEIRDKRVANKRKEAGLTAPEWVSFNIMGKKLGAGPKGGIIAARSDDGRVKSYSHYSRIAARARSTDQPKNAIRAGRERAAKKGYKVKGYTGNLTSRGYTGSRGQASNNKATSKALSRREHMDYLKKNRSIKGGKAGLVNPNEPKRYTRRTERAHKEALKRDEEFIKYLTEAANYSSSRKKRK